MDKQTLDDKILNVNAVAVERRLIRLENTVFGMGENDGVITTMRLLEARLIALSDLIEARLDQHLTFKGMMQNLILPVVVAIVTALITYALIGG
jgi:hypothetical protein